MASMLLQRPAAELCESGLRLTDLIREHDAYRTLAALSSPSIRMGLPSSLSAPEMEEITQESTESNCNDGVLFSGKVVEVETTDNGAVPVSLWMKELPAEPEEDPRWIAVMEPVESTVATVSLDVEGLIRDCSAEFAALFGVSEDVDLNYCNIRNFIPAFKMPTPGSLMPEDIARQMATGETRDGAAFPLSCQLQYFGDKERSEEELIHLEIWVFSNMSGLVVLDEAGKIIDFNRNFIRLMFGYEEKQIMNKDVTALIPSFYEDTELINTLESPLFDSDSEDEDSECHNVDGKENSPQEKTTDSVNKGFCVSTSKGMSCLESTDPIDSTNTENNSIGHFAKPVSNMSLQPAMKDITNSLNLLNVSEPPHRSGLKNDIMGTPAVLDESSLPPNLPSSTPALSKTSSVRSARIVEGSFFGVAKHLGGSDLYVIYQIRKIVFEGSECPRYYMWILRNPEEPGEGDKPPNNLTQASSLNDTIDKSLGDAIKRTAAAAFADDSTDSVQEAADSPSEASTNTDGSSADEYSIHEEKPLTVPESKISTKKIPVSLETEKLDNELVRGEYGRKYAVLRQIGKGAFGYVKMSYNISDGLMVVTKFIKKKKVYSDSWVDDPKLGKRVPLEVSLLLSLNHPNIVKAVGVFENLEYFQLVLEKWGAGMDLFEFIDRAPKMDECLTSHIFRQIVDSVGYLHKCNILHRDIKDENVIIDHEFNIKLIDFGSAAFTSPGKLFSQFAGTMEYCSPEVLRGNKYSGFEAEIWSLGVTLFALVFFESPFYNVDETLKSELRFPSRRSSELLDLLSGMLDKSMATRYDLNKVHQHSWTRQFCDTKEYEFSKVIKCSEEESSPKKYIGEYVEEMNSDISSLTASFTYTPGPVSPQKQQKQNVAASPASQEEKTACKKLERFYSSVSEKSQTESVSSAASPIHSRSWSTVSIEESIGAKNMSSESSEDDSHVSAVEEISTCSSTNTTSDDTSTDREIDVCGLDSEQSVIDVSSGSTCSGADIADEDQRGESSSSSNSDSDASSVLESSLCDQ